jgi:hypothetical protein
MRVNSPDKRDDEGMRALVIAVLLAACGSDEPTKPDVHEVVMCEPPWAFGSDVPNGCTEFQSCCEYACRDMPIAMGPPCSNASNPYVVTFNGSCTATETIDGLLGCCGQAGDKVIRYFVCQ